MVMMNVEGNMLFETSTLKTRRPRPVALSLSEYQARFIIQMAIRRGYIVETGIKIGKLQRYLYERIDEYRKSNEVGISFTRRDVSNLSKIVIDMMLTFERQGILVPDDYSDVVFLRRKKKGTEVVSDAVSEQVVAPTFEAREYANPYGSVTHEEVENFMSPTSPYKKKTSGNKKSFEVKQWERMANISYKVGDNFNQGFVAVCKLLSEGIKDADDCGLESYKSRFIWSWGGTNLLTDFELGQILNLARDDKALEHMQTPSEVHKVEEVAVVEEEISGHGVAMPRARKLIISGKN